MFEYRNIYKPTKYYCYFTISDWHNFSGNKIPSSCFISLNLSGLPFPELQNFFSVILDFHFYWCIEVCSICAVKIRTISNLIISEKAKFRKPIPRKKMWFFRWHFLHFFCLSDISLKIIDHCKSTDNNHRYIAPLPCDKFRRSSRWSKFL